MGLNDKSSRKNYGDISSRMALISAISMISLVIVFGIISFIVASVKTETDSQVTMHNAANVISGIVSDYMDVKLSQVSELASDESAADYADALGEFQYGADAVAYEGSAAMQETLNRMVITGTDIVSAWIISEESGVLVADNGRFLDADILNLTGKYWHKGFAFNKGMTCTASSESFFDESINTVSVISPLYKNGNLVGYAGIEVDTNGISKILNQYTLSSGCYPIITCNYGTVVYSPESEEFNK